jgi:DNA modification methylase
MNEPIAIEKNPQIHDPNDVEIEEVDRIICEEIEQLTKENDQIWTSPDHDKRDYVHGFFQYPAMMVPVVQKRLIQIILANKKDIKTVFDPYMGSGTSLVACMENGLDCYGQDINPLAILVAKARTGPFYFDAIRKKKADLFRCIEDDSSSEIEAFFRGRNKWFKRNVAIELSKIVRAIRQERKISIRRLYWVCLAETVRLTSNDRTSTFKLHIRPKSEIKSRKLSPIESFRLHFERCLDDIRSYAELLKRSANLRKGAYTGDISINLADSKKVIRMPNKADGAKFDLLITSPPYGDNKTTVTYGQHSYLPLQWVDLPDIDEKATVDYLKSKSEIDSRGLGGKINPVAEEDLKLLFNSSPALKKVYPKIALADPKKVKKVISFFKDIYQSIVRIHSSLAVNSYQIWTIGNRTVAGIEIPNNEIMAEFIQSQGSKLVKKISREILCRRMATRNSSASLMTYEEIIIFRKLSSK